MLLVRDDIITEFFFTYVTVTVTGINVAVS